MSFFAIWHPLAFRWLANLVPSPLAYKAAFTQRSLEWIRCLWWSFKSWRHGIYTHLYSPKTVHVIFDYSTVSCHCHMDRVHLDELPRTAARRKNTKNPSRTSCTLRWDPSLRHARSPEYGMTMPITFAQVRIFAVYTSVFPGSVFKVST